MQADIRSLLSRPELSVTESEILQVFKRRRLTSTLDILGQTSRWIVDKNTARPYLKIEENGRAYGQWAVAYFVNMALVSGSNDHKELEFTPQEIDTLFDVYNNKLVDHFTRNDDATLDTARELFIGMFNEQVFYWGDTLHEIARVFMLFHEIAPTMEPVDIDPIEKVFSDKTGLSIRTYLHLAFFCYAQNTSKAGYLDENFYNHELPSDLSGVDLLTKENIEKLSKHLGISYQEFKREDSKINKGDTGLYTKFRHNPLRTHPVLLQPNSEIKIVPNPLTFQKMAFRGLFWQVDALYYERGEIQSFRNYFGQVFEEYVGKLLASIYGPENVKRGDEYAYDKDKKQFFDWIVFRQDRVLLFETKIYQFTRRSRIKPNISEIKASEVKKLEDANTQMQKAIGKINEYEELKAFREKNLKPIGVFLDFPFISTNFYQDLTRDLDHELPIPSYINIDDLEWFGHVESKLELDVVLSKSRESMNAPGPMAQFSEANKEKSLPHNQLLEKVMEKYIGHPDSK